MTAIPGFEGPVQVAARAHRENWDRLIEKGVRSQTEDASVWREFGSKFRALHEQEHNPTNYLESCLEAEVYYDDVALQWRIDLTNGMDNDSADLERKEDFKATATLAGKALGVSTLIPPLDAWLYSLFQHLRRNRKIVLATEKGGTIRKVCAESARYCKVLEREALENAARPSRFTSKAPAPISPVRGSYIPQKPKPSELPTDLPRDYPPILKLRTWDILAKTVKEFPDRSRLDELCKAIVSELTPLLRAAVQDGTLQGHSAPDHLDSLLHCVRVANCDDSNKRFALEKAVKSSGEWHAMVSQLVECEKESSSNRPSAASSASRRQEVDAFILALKNAGHEVKRRDIWLVAGYKDASEFERFQRHDARTTKIGIANFERILRMSPADFMDQRKNRARK